MTKTSGSQPILRQNDAMTGSSASGSHIGPIVVQPLAFAPRFEVNLN